MSIFSEVKEQISARMAAEYYGLKVGRNGMACCPFHDDRHPSMKIDTSYHCFACGAHGDAVGYVANMYGLSQYDAAVKLVSDFGLQIQSMPGRKLSHVEKFRIHKGNEKRKRLVRIKERFAKWCRESIELLKASLRVIEETEKMPTELRNRYAFSDDYAVLLHAKPRVSYWLDILCMGDESDRKELFLTDRREVENLAEHVQSAGGRLLGRDRGSA